MRLAVIPIFACAALVVAASPASAAVAPAGNTPRPLVVVNDPVGTVYSDTWSAPVKSGVGQMRPAWDAGACRGSFTELIQNTGSVQFGAYWQCTSKVNTTVRAYVQECDQLSNGSFYCSLENESAGPTANNTAYFNRSDAYFACNPNKTKYFRPVARFLTVQGTNVANKYGTPRIGTC